MDLSNYAVCTGKFDGFNREHKKLIKKTIQSAKENKLASAALVYDDINEYILSPEEKDFFIKHEGIKEIYHVNTNYKPNSKIIYTESNECPNLNEIHQNEINALKKGDIEKYENCSGYNYIIIDKVIHGDALGQTVGMPTANLVVEKGKIIPANGVYASIVNVCNENKMGLTNIMPKKSINNQKCIETNIIEFDEDIYDKKILLQMKFHIRNVKKFNNLNEVKNQVDADKNNIIKKLNSIYTNI